MVRPDRPADEREGRRWAAGERRMRSSTGGGSSAASAPVKDDTDVTDAESPRATSSSGAIPRSNKMLAKIADKLPIGGTRRASAVGAQNVSRDHHVPVLIYPNPLNPKRYVVLNSGFTFREYDYLEQRPPDLEAAGLRRAGCDVPVSSRAPGGIVEAGFFGEQWELPEN